MVKYLDESRMMAVIVITGLVCLAIAAWPALARFFTQALHLVK